jgi:hypothetical protein
MGKMRWPGDEVPPPSALAGRVAIEKEVEAERGRDRLGKGLLGRGDFWEAVLGGAVKYK